MCIGAMSGLNLERFTWNRGRRTQATLGNGGLCLTFFVYLLFSQFLPSAYQAEADNQQVRFLAEANTIDCTKDQNRPCSLNTSLCDNVSITTNSAAMFLEYLKMKKANFAFFKVLIENSSLISRSKTPDVFYESVWVWTIIGEGGAFPYLSYSSDFDSLSFGLLGQYTADGVQLNLTTDSPEPCHLVMGAYNSTQTLAHAFNAMMEKAYSSYSRYRNSVFCYWVKHQSYGPLLYYVTHLLGIQKGYIGYKCCYQKEDPHYQGRTISECRQNIEKMTNWYCVLYILVFLSFFYGPFVICSVAHRFTVLDYEKPGNLLIDGYIPLLSGKVQEDTSSDSEVERWIYLGVDNPITLSKLFCRAFYSFHSCPVLASRLQRLILLLLTPSVICFKLYWYLQAWKGRWISNSLLNDIPVGFLALPFGFEASRKNWGYLFGGPYVMYSVFFSVGLILFLLPRSFCRIMTSCLISEKRWTGSLLSIDLLTLEKWGNTKLSHLTGYNLICNIVTANFYMLLNLHFWRFVKYLFLSRMNELSKRLRKCFGEGCFLKFVFRIVQCLMFVLYAAVCMFELLCALVYYGLPTVFLAITLLRGYNNWAGQVFHWLKLRILTNTIVTLLTVHNLIAFAILYLCSAIYIIEAMYFTYTGVIVYPSISTGYVIGAGTLAYYLVGNIRQFNDKFSELLELTVAASTNLESSRHSKRLCKLKDNAIILSSGCAAGIHSIRVEGAIDFQLTDTQKMQLTICGQFGRQRSLVKWRDNQLGIPYNLFLYVMRRYCPLHVHVFWFLFRLAVFCLIVISITTLLASYNINKNFAIPAQIITAVSLNVLPRMMEVCVSKLDIRLGHEHYKRCLETTVEDYWTSNIDLLTRD